MSVYGDVPAYHLGQLASAVSAGEPEEQDRGVAALKDLVGPASAPLSGGRYEQPDVVDQQRISWGAGSVPRRGVLAPYPRQGCSDEFVRGRGQVAGRPVLMVDRRDPGAEGGDGVGPLPCFGSGVGGVDEISGNGDRVRRKRHVTIRLAPGW